MNYPHKLALILILSAASTYAQAPQFEVASIHENKSNAKPYSNFPLSPGPQFAEAGGVFSARNLPLLQYIVFAFKPANSYQIGTLRATLPDWVRSARFDIEARAPGNPTKDEFRQMMQQLLIARFHIAVHRELRKVPVFSLVLVKPGKFGPRLIPHPASDPNCAKEPLPPAVPGAYPPICGDTASAVPTMPGYIAIAGHNVPISHLVLGLSNAQNDIERPILDATGLTGTYDLTLEWAPEANGPNTNDAVGATFLEALHDQLGMKLVPAKGPVEVLLLDHIEPLTEN